ncbi:MAG: hypothetical protein J6A15_09210 [Clostridia bacterium]|nr:hypothetical protein [Clostridia bacterium]
MYRRANVTDVDEIAKIPNIDFSKEEIIEYLKNGAKYLYVYENESNNIVNATFFGSDAIDDDSYDSEIYGMYTRNIKDKEIVNSEVLFYTKKELFEKGFRNLIVWCDEKNEKMKKFLKSSGGIESKKRENNNRIEVAYTYELIDYPEE